MAPRTRSSWDVIIVLAGFQESDADLSRWSHARTHQAIRLFRRGLAPRILFSGKGSFLTDLPTVSEARTMQELAQRHGVPASRTMVEEQSLDTIGNAYYTARNWLQPNGWRRAIVVTSDFHLPRTRWLFQHILGPDYTWRFVSAPSGLTGRALRDRQAVERTILAMSQKWLRAIPPGSLGRIGAFIQRRHPGYKLRRDPLRRLLAGWLYRHPKLFRLVQPLLARVR